MNQKLIKINAILNSNPKFALLKQHVGMIRSFSSKPTNYQESTNLDIMRSLLYIPGNSEKMLNKIHSMKERPDVFVPDLEDSVPYHQKEEARKIVRDFLLSTFTPDLVSEYRMHIIPRVNREWEFLESDCEAVAIPGVVSAINVGKTSSIADVFDIDQLLTRIENKLNVPQYTFRIIPSIESAIGLVHAYQICSCLPQRTIGVAFGGDDYAHDLGFTRDTTQVVEKELTFARSAVAVAARAAGIPSFDTPNVNFKNLDGLKEESMAVKNMGMKGKFAIHPSQIPVLNQVFGPSSHEIEEATIIVEAYEKAAKENNRGSCQVNGRMVDMPVYRNAKQVLAWANKTRK